MAKRLWLMKEAPEQLCSREYFTGGSFAGDTAVAFSD
jgi:hypothetical protein